MALPRWVRARVGVRVGSALAAAVAVALALVIAGAALVLLVDQSLRGTVEHTAHRRAEQVADRVAGNYRNEVKENAVEAVDSLATSNELVQVITDYSPESESRNGIVVLGSTEPLRDLPPMSAMMPAPGETETVARMWVTAADGRIVDAVLVTRGDSTLGRDVVVQVAVPLDSVHAATDTVLFYLLFGVPLLILVAGATTYLFAGRALRPVEAIRSQVVGMTEKDLGRRVPVPPARDEVGRLAETMNAMLARLESAQGVQRRFVADASHELRSPLATIATGLELLAHPGTADAEMVATLRGETERLTRLVDGLLLLARADERGLRPRREEVDLDEVAQAEQGRPGDGGARVAVRAAPVRVMGDRGQLVRVVRNLVDNALRYARSQVLVTVRAQDGEAILEVADDGPGVPAGDRARVFERFVRLDDARARADGGSGLGLAIVSEVVAAHGGSVEVLDAPLGGALFCVRLPVALPPPRDPEIREGSSPPVASGPRPPAAPRRAAVPAS